VGTGGTGVDEGNGAENVKFNLANRINAALESYLPEQRLFLKSDRGMRYVRLKPVTQAVMITGSSLFVGWTVIVTAIFLIDAISAGGVRDQSERAQLAYQDRLNQLSEERDTRAAEAQASQTRFGVAMAEVSDMQSRLLGSEERRRELETAVEVIQTTLRRVMSERDDARTQTSQLLAELEAETGSTQTTAGRLRDLELTLDYMANALDRAADERDDAYLVAESARDEVDELEFTAALADERNERIFAQLEEAVLVSMEPLDQMFSAAGLSTDDIIGRLQTRYQGQGGPLMPITMSSRGEAPDSLSLRANQILGQLDTINMRRIAAERLPFSEPVYQRTRFSSPFGMRNGRMHNGVDLAGPMGTPLYATADGVVTVAERQNGYGLIVTIQHDLGYETRFAHMSRLGVTAGQRVSRGDTIGDMGSSGRSTGSHVHYEIRRNGTPLNPMSYITAGRDVF
jgi:murein DD-endopeptidase MepM/ murein hydrolase activator NlpD